MSTFNCGSRMQEEWWPSPTHLCAWTEPAASSSSHQADEKGLEESGKKRKPVEKMYFFLIRTLFLTGVDSGSLLRNCISLTMVFCFYLFIYFYSECLIVRVVKSSCSSTLCTPLSRGLDSSQFHVTRLLLFAEFFIFVFVFIHILKFSRLFKVFFSSLIL